MYTCTHLEIRIESDELRWCEGQGEEVAERIPEPKLREDEQPDGRLHVHVPGPGLEGDCDVAAAGVDDSLPQDGAELCDSVLVFVSDDLGVVLAVEGRLWRHQLSVLDQNHGGSHQGGLVCVWGGRG